MAVYKCKMCGASLDITEGKTVCECEYCGTKQTVPTADNEKKMTLFTRANRLRFACEFDKAAGIYESIIVDFPEEAEAYWGLVLCKYGIEYVDDPLTGKKIPTCHRSSFDSVLEDDSFEQVMETADPTAKAVYREEAKVIENIRRNIIEVSSREAPYDIFICYKETDEDGNRTIDSVIAQDIYDALTEKGYRVFFARISLEDKLGTAYEPYIFSALNSAKIMLAIGTSYDYYNAVWVKNEWSRFLQLITKGEKKTLIPCYKDVDAYDIPPEFKHLQAQDMGKVGAIQDLLRGIDKIIGGSLPAPKKETAPDNNAEALLNNIKFLLEEEKWGKADEQCDKLIYIAPSCSVAYLFKIIIGDRIKKNTTVYGKKLDNDLPEVSEQEKALLSSKYEEYFWLLLQAGTVTRAKYVLSLHPEIMTKNYTDKDNPEIRSLLCYAIAQYSKNAVVVKTLLECGADPNSFRICAEKNHMIRHCALSDAILIAKNAEMVKLFLEAGVDPKQFEEIVCDSGMVGYISLLSNAVICTKNAEIVNMLIDAGADPNTYRVYKSQFGQAFHFVLCDAVWNCKKVEMVKILLQRGANPNSYYEYFNKYGKNVFSALSSAIWNARNVEMVKLLLDAGADPNRVETIIDEDGVTDKKSMLTYAIIDANNAEMIKLLLDHGTSWDNEIRYAKREKTDRKFPFHKYFHFSTSFLNFLKASGWKGSLF